MSIKPLLLINREHKRWIGFEAFAQTMKTNNIKIKNDDDDFQFSDDDGQSLEIDSIDMLDLDPMPDPKLISLDFIPKVEFLVEDFKERRKRKMTSLSEAEQHVIQLNSLDFHKFLNKTQHQQLEKWEHIDKSKALGYNSNDAQRSYFTSQHKDPIYLNYQDLQSFITDFHQEQKQLSFNSKFAQYIEDKAMQIYNEQNNQNKSYYQRKQTRSNSQRGLTFPMRKSDPPPDSKNLNGKKSILTIQKGSALLSIRRRGTVQVPALLRPIHHEKIVDQSIVKDYVAKMPECIKENKLNVDERVFSRYQQLFMKSKKQLEIGILKENKEQEILNKIASLCEEQEEDRLRIRNKKQFQQVMGQYRFYSKVTKNKYKRRFGILVKDYQDFKDNYLGFLQNGNKNRKSKSLQFRMF
ncbi:UNKNOWN [Stylonychia lemnae]|uniref:Uncharacterized protein n=1 Tax=Stylonychia lemnae TaxID=5949 RepID=A0A077ZXX5_STYLE|nr:UNKNOWN [Stylonychia lemnae]|eukprot:CDW74447.1 UNKNOWN [Stylonychia lemnae]